MDYSSRVWAVCVYQFHHSSIFFSIWHWWSPRVVLLFLLWRIFKRPPFYIFINYSNHEPNDRLELSSKRYKGFVLPYKLIRHYVPQERLELSIVRVLNPLCIPVPPLGHYAETVGFEPTNRFHDLQISNLLLSATQPRFQCRGCGIWTHVPHLWD